MIMTMTAPKLLTKQIFYSEILIYFTLFLYSSLPSYNENEAL